MFYGLLDLNLFLTFLNILVLFLIKVWIPFWLSCPSSSDSKAAAYNAGDPGLIPGSERSPGEGNGNPLQYSCLENPMDQGNW